MDISVVVAVIAVILAAVVFVFRPSRRSPPRASVTVAVRRAETGSKASGTTKGVNEKEESSAPRISIFFGSQTGTAEGFSRRVAESAKRHGFVPTVIDLEDYDYNENFAQEPLVVFVVATYGDGEPTDNAVGFYNWIMDKERPTDCLLGVAFTVFGLGNRQYEHFCAMGRAMDRRLAELGGTRIFNAGEGDEEGNLENDFIQWNDEMWPVLCRHQHVDVRIAENTDNSPSRRFKLVCAQPNEILPAAPRFPVIVDSKHPYCVKIVTNRELHTKESERSCRHIEFSLEGARFSYQTGDHLGVLPENDPILVEKLASRLGVDLDTVFSLVATEGEHPDVVRKQHFPGPTTLRFALTHYVDIAGMPSKSTLGALAPYASDPVEKEHLILLGSASEEGMAAYRTFIHEDCRNIVEVLEDMPSLAPPFDYLLELLPRLQVRFYSIASSPRVHYKHIHIVMMWTMFKKPTNRIHNGVCTTWLRHKEVVPDEENPMVPVFVRRSTFKLPADDTVPIIMVGAGTGIAPFRAFLQERASKRLAGVDVGKCVLFFGCRSRTQDFVYGEELTQWEKDGIVTLFLAFSREQQAKVYVQDRMREAKALIWDLLSTKGGSFYVCGDAKRMARDVHQALVDVVRACSGQTDVESESFVQSLLTTGRYMTDVW